MKSTITTLTIVVIALAITSCGPKLVPFTGEFEYKTGLNKEQLKHVQFYNSGPIVLFREINDNTTQILRGEIIMRNGKQLEQVVIPPHTPGVVINSSRERLGVSFEKGTDRYLVFGRNPRRANAYTLLAKDWVNSLGSVEYDGKEFKVNTTSASTYLIVNTKVLKDLDVSSRTAKGRTVGKL